MGRMALPSYLRRPKSPIFFSRLRLSLSFHKLAIAPSQPRPEPSPSGGSSNLLRRKNLLPPRRDYNPNESHHFITINKLAVAKKFDAIESLMQKIKADPQCRLSDAFLRNVIRIYGHSAGWINRAIELLFDMPSYKCRPSAATLNCVLNLLVSTKQCERAHEVYRGASKLGVKMEACCLNINIKALCESKQIDGALQVLDEFPQQKCSPTVKTYSTIMHAMCKGGRVDESFRLLERMEAEGVEVDATVYNILISGLRKEGRAEEGVEMLEKMSLNLKGCEPNPGTYQAVLYCWLDSKKFGEAKKFMETMIDKGIKPSFESYNVIIHGFCRENEVEHVEWGLREMVSHGYVPKMGMWKTMVQCLISHQNSAHSHSYSLPSNNII